MAQNSLSKALRRLIDAGAVTGELRHVAGAPRRLKCYALTPGGEAIARRLPSEGVERSVLEPDGSEPRDDQLLGQ